MEPEEQLSKLVLEDVTKKEFQILKEYAAEENLLYYHFEDHDIWFPHEETHEFKLGYNPKTKECRVFEEVRGKLVLPEKWNTDEYGFGDIEDILSDIIDQLREYLSDYRKRDQEATEGTAGYEF